MATPVLIVAPDPALRELVAYGLGRAGLLLESAETGGEALARLHGTRPAALVLDLVLPDIHGVGVIEIVRQLWPNDPVPLIVLSSRPLVEVQADLLELGVDAVLGKPFELEELVTVISRFVGGGRPVVRKRARTLAARRKVRRRSTSRVG